MKVNLSEAQKRIAKRKMVEKGIASQETKKILSRLPKCPHDSYPRICPQCLNEKYKNEVIPY